jgi:beta propeller repeat protein
MRIKIITQLMAVVAVFSISVKLIGQRPGIECGCEKYGDYISPAVKTIFVSEGSVYKEGFSAEKDPKYRLVAEPAAPPYIVRLSIYSGDRLIFSDINTANGWGFSPDQDKFAMHGLTGDQKHWCTLVDLNPDQTTEDEEPAVHYIVPASNVISSSSIAFSPHGKYLVYASVNGSTGSLDLKIFDTNTGLSAYNYSTNNIVGSAAGKSIAGWGFSSDAKDATFMHSFLVDVNMYALYVVNLTKKPYEYVLEAPANNNSYGYATFSFSPCGDYFAWIYENINTAPKCRLYRTDSNEVFEEAGANYFDKIFLASDGHYISYVNGTSPVRIVQATTGSTCPDIQKPYWESNKTLEADEVEGVKIKLKWAGDKDAFGVTAYRIYLDNKLYNEYEAVKREAWVTGLNPNTSYQFRIEAGDDSNNWSTDGPANNFTTAGDDPPTWPDDRISYSNLTETKITLTWKDATDDYRIKSYRIKVDGEEVGKVGKETLSYTAKKLNAGAEYTFGIDAGDEAGQWTAGPEITVSMPLPVPPEWTDGSVLRDSAKTETSFILKWPKAYDYYDAITGYEVWMNDQLLVTTMHYMFDWVVKDLEEGTVYSCEIIAIDESGNKSDPLRGFISTLPSYVLDTLVSAPGNQKQPDISGDLVVWWDNRNDDGDIYSIHLQTDSIKRITTNPHLQYEPAVSGERIVWTDLRNGNKDIYLYDPDLGEIPICTANGDQDMPAIDGDIIVWRDTRSGDFDIYMFDLSTMTESPVCTRTSNQNWPDVSDRFIVYADDRNGNWDIFMYLLHTKKEYPICTNSKDQTHPSITGKATLISVVYMDEREGKNIYYYRPFYLGLEGKEYPLSLDQYPVISTQAYPHLEDRQMVYQDLYGVNDGVTWSIYAYQLRGNYPVYGDKLMQISVSEFANQTNPRTSKGNIVWEHEYNGDTDIHIWKRPPGSDLQLSVKEITDPVMVGDTLKYILKVLNNGPNNNYFVTTTATLPVMAKYVSAVADKGVVNQEGLTLTWNIDTLFYEQEASLEISLHTFELTVLEFSAETEGGAFEMDPSNNQIKETTKVKSVFPSNVDEGGMSAMVVEKTGKVHLAYFRNDTLMYAWKNRTDRKWVFRMLGYCANSKNISMVMAPDKSLHIIYSDNHSTGDIYLLCRLYHGIISPEGNWTSRIIGLARKGFHSLSPGVRNDGELYLAWQEASNVASQGPFMIRKTLNGTWQSPKLIFEEGYDHIDLAVDDENNVHLSFYSLNNGGILYQKWSGDLAGPVEKTEPDWAGGQMEGMVTSILTDNMNRPHISYAGSVNRDYRENVKYSWKQDGIWNTQMVDNGSYASSGNQLAFGPTGETYFGYNHVPSDQTRFSTRINRSWLRQTVDEKSSGWELEMDVDGDRYGHMALPGVQYALIPPLPYFNIDPDSLDFGAVEPDSSKTIQIILTNPSDKNISIDKIIGGDTRFSVNKTNLILKRYDKDTILVTFIQDENALKVNTWLSFEYNTTSGLMIEIPMVVRTWGPALSANVERIDFGSVPKNILETRSVKIENTGITDLIISDINVKFELYPGYTVPTDFLLSGHNCSTLQPGQSCDVQVSFKPIKDGSQFSYLNILTNDREIPLKKIQLTGKTPLPQIQPDKSSITFSYCPAGESRKDTLALINIGDATLNITSMNLSGASMNSFTYSTTDYQIEPGDTGIIETDFRPDSPGNYYANLRITSNSQWSNILNITLTGTSYLRTLEISEDFISFDPVPVGEKSYKLIEYRNTGVADLVISRIESTGSDIYEFRYNTYYLELAPDSNYIDTIWFVPLYEGGKTAEMIIHSNDSYVPVQKIILTGQAGAVVPLHSVISANPESGLEPLTVQFHSSVSGGQPPYSYFWDFDDLNTSIDASPVHEFFSSGVNNITMTVTDVTGNAVTRTIEVTVAQEGLPVVMALAEPVYGEIPLEVQFNAMTVGGDLPLTYLWKFGDGATNTQVNPIHWFSFPGTYWVKVTVTDNNGDTSTDSVKITAIWNKSLSGSILDETGSMAINKSRVMLFPENATEATKIDTLQASNAYLFPGLASGKYTVLAVPDAVEYPSDLPTYLGNKLSLAEANWLNVNGHETDKDIRLFKKPPGGLGTGIIAGSLVTGDLKKELTIIEGKSRTTEQAVADVYVFLKNSSTGNLVAYDITKSTGAFRFDKLSNGSYQFLTDYQGKPMDSNNRILNISDTKDSIMILAVVGSNKITVQEITTGIDEEKMPTVKAYPVPVSEYLFLLIPEGLFQGNSVRIRILDISGRFCYVDRNYDITGGLLPIELDFPGQGIFIVELSDIKKNIKLKIVKL